MSNRPIINPYEAIELIKRGEAFSTFSAWLVMRTRARDWLNVAEYEWKRSVKDRQAYAPELENFRDWCKQSMSEANQ